MRNNGRLLIPRDNSASIEMLKISREVSNEIGKPVNTDTFVFRNNNEMKGRDRRQ